MDGPRHRAKANETNDTTDDFKTPEDSSTGKSLWQPRPSTRTTLILYALAIYGLLLLLKASLVPIWPLPPIGELDIRGLTAVQKNLIDVEEMIASNVALPIQIKYAEAVILDASAIASAANLPSR